MLIKVKKKKYDFQKELMTNLPQQYQIETEKKTKEMDQKINQLLNIMGDSKQMISTVGNVRDILNTDINSSINKNVEESEKIAKESLG